MSAIGKISEQTIIQYIGRIDHKQIEQVNYVLI